MKRIYKVKDDMSCLNGCIDTKMSRTRVYELQSVCVRSSKENSMWDPGEDHLAKCRILNQITEKKEREKPRLRFVIIFLICISASIVYSFKAGDKVPKIHNNLLNTSIVYSFKAGDQVPKIHNKLLNSSTVYAGDKVPMIHTKSVEVTLSWCYKSNLKASGVIADCCVTIKIKEKIDKQLQCTFQFSTTLDTFVKVKFSTCNKEDDIAPYECFSFYTRSYMVVEPWHGTIQFNATFDTSIKEREKSRLSFAIIFLICISAFASKVIFLSCMRQHAMWDPGAGHFVKKTQRVRSRNLHQITRNKRLLSRLARYHKTKETAMKTEDTLHVRVLMKTFATRLCGLRDHALSTDHISMFSAPLNPGKTLNRGFSICYRTNSSTNWEPSFNSWK